MPDLDVALSRMGCGSSDRFDGLSASLVLFPCARSARAVGMAGAGDGRREDGKGTVELATRAVESSRGRGEVWFGCRCPCFTSIVFSFLSFSFFFVLSGVEEKKKDEAEVYCTSCVIQ